MSKRAQSGVFQNLHCVSIFCQQAIDQSLPRLVTNAGVLTENAMVKVNSCKSLIDFNLKELEKSGYCAIPELLYQNRKQIFCMSMSGISL